MNLNTMTREDMIAFIKRTCVKVVKEIPEIPLKVGEYYFISYATQSGAVYAIDDAFEHEYFINEAHTRECLIMEEDNNANT